MNPEEKNVVLSYGGLKALSKKLEKEIFSLNQKVYYLKKENCLQYEVIKHLKTMKTLPPVPPIKCDYGHYKCKIDHSRYNFVNVCPKPDASKTLVPNRDFAVKKNESESLLIKKLSKKVDVIQSRYGFPSYLKNFIMVASVDTIFIQSKSSESKGLDNGNK